MAHILRETHIVEQSDRGAYSTVGRTRTTDTVARIVYFISGVITALLALRFVFALLGANPSNAFANFIYTASRPFVAPFFGLFNYQSHYGVSRFELETLIAMAVYALVAWAIVRMVAAATNTEPNTAVDE